MQVNQDIVETQVANSVESICKRLHEIAAEIERLPYVIQENLERQRHYQFYDRLLAEDTGAMKCQK